MSRRYVVTVRAEKPHGYMMDYAYGVAFPSTETVTHQADDVGETDSGALQFWRHQRNRIADGVTPVLVASYAKGAWLHVQEVTGDE